jgi:hypothetical protein
MNDPADLARRVAAMEVRLSRLRAISLLSFGVAAGALGWGLMQRADPVTEGQLWIAKDGAGRVRGLFGVSGDGVGLTMYDSTGQMRLDLGIAPGGVPGLLLLSKRGEPVAAVNVPDGGVPTIRLTNLGEETRVDIVPSASATAVRVQGPVQPDTMIARRVPR